MSPNGGYDDDHKLVKCIHVSRTRYGYGPPAVLCLIRVSVSLYTLCRDRITKYAFDIAPLWLPIAQHYNIEEVIYTDYCKYLNYNKNLWCL